MNTSAGSGFRREKRVTFEGRGRSEPGWGIDADSIPGVTDKPPGPTSLATPVNNGPPLTPAPALRSGVPGICPQWCYVWRA